MGSLQNVQNRVFKSDYLLSSSIHVSQYEGYSEAPSIYRVFAILMFAITLFVSSAADSILFSTLMGIEDLRIVVR